MAHFSAQVKPAGQHVERRAPSEEPRAERLLWFRAQGDLDEVARPDPLGEGSLHLCGRGRQVPRGGAERLVEGQVPCGEIQQLGRDAIREKGTGQYAVDTLELAGESPAPGAGSAPG